MILLVGDTRSRSLLRAIAEPPHKASRVALGQLVQRGRLDGWLRQRAAGARHWRWAYDNGAYADWRAGQPFDAPAFRRDVDRIVALPPAQRASWLVLPDVVSGGRTSLALSLSWLRELWGAVPCYLAVQEGFAPTDVPEREADMLAGIFVGGASWAWKQRAVRTWSAWARPRGLLLHVGRAGSASRLAWCRSTGRVHSADSNAPLWNAAAWDLALGALRAPMQPALPGLEDS